MLNLVIILFSSGLIGLLIHSDVFAKFLNTPNEFAIGLFFASLGLLAFLLSILLAKVKKRTLLFVFMGIVAGIVFSWLLAEAFLISSLALRISGSFFFVILGILYSYHLAVSGFSFSKSCSISCDNYKILDTSAIVDARIADVAEAGFLEGSLVVPEFVLKELQGIADSKENVTRNKGRHGLDILNRLKNISACNLVISGDPVNEQKEVDHKLLVLTEKLQGVLVTVDYNLNKIAHLKGISVLNINELANALKPNVAVGDSIEVLVSKAGKEPEQGVGYFDDGTMVVIEDGHDYIGKSVVVAVTSVFQTDAGRMIFSCVGNK